jgi:hypothetical protein
LASTNTLCVSAFIKPYFLVCVYFVSELFNGDENPHVGPEKLVWKEKAALAIGDSGIGNSYFSGIFRMVGYTVWLYWLLHSIFDLS